MREAQLLCVVQVVFKHKMARRGYRNGGGGGGESLGCLFQVQEIYTGLFIGIRPWPPLKSVGAPQLSLELMQNLNGRLQSGSKKRE